MLQLFLPACGEAPPYWSCKCVSCFCRPMRSLSLLALISMLIRKVTNQYIQWPGLAIDTISSTPFTLPRLNTQTQTHTSTPHTHIKTNKHTKFKHYTWALFSNCNGWSFSNCLGQICHINLITESEKLNSICFHSRFCPTPFCPRTWALHVHSP